MRITNQRRDELQKEGLMALHKQGEPKFTDKWFPYTSGEIGPYYIQSIAVTRDGADYHRAIDAICELISGTIGPNNFDSISGGETRDWDFSNPVAYALSKPHIKLYETRKPEGIIKGKRIIHVADLNNEGSSMKNKWIPTLKENGGELVHAYFYVDRMEKGAKLLYDMNIPNHSVISMDDDAWNFLLRIGAMNPEIRDTLIYRRDNEKLWAHTKLRTNIDILEELLKSDDKKKRASGEKILNVGYPEIKDELLELMRSRGYEHKFGQ